MNKLYFMSQIIVFALVIIGVGVVGITTHELKHVYDLGEDAEIKEICVLNLPTEYNGIKDILFEQAAGYVLYTKGDESSELPAYIIMIIVLFILTVFIIIYIRGDPSDGKTEQ